MPSVTVPIDRRAEVDALLDAALDLKPAERRNFLDGIAEVELRAEVAELLRYADAATDPLELNAAAAAAMLDAWIDAPGGTPPDRIGAWRVLEPLGTGGMGEVYRVVRDDAGFAQVGALKMIRVGYGDGDFARRFVQERQILARLNHPSIAGLLDGGFDGIRHYLVMEYVEGERIDRYCDRQCLNLSSRIDTFIEVARAVAHAHRVLIVHRDLKPANILVRNDGCVKLLDFGIAKVLDDDGGDPMATRLEQRMFTPEYASPEQARGESVGTASDVYQLGILLYELLCGCRAQPVKAGSPAEIERAIVDSHPAPMSQRAEIGMGQLAAQRSSSPTALRRLLRGDLELIVAKAIEKNIDRRYPSVDALIADLERSRAGLPLLAKPDSLAYRSRRFLRRHPVGIGFALTTTLFVIGYVATLLTQSAALERERDRARAEADKARQVQSLVQRLFSGIDPDVSGGKPLSVSQLLERSFGDIDRELTSQPDVRAELLLTVADVYFALGDYKQARELLERAQTLLHENMNRSLLAARIDRSLGRVLSLNGQLTTAEDHLRRALDIFAVHSSAVDQASTMYLLSGLKTRQDQWPEALSLAQNALDLRRQSLPARHPDVAESLIQLASIVRGEDDLPGAEELLREALALMETDLPPSHPRLAEVRADLASLLRAQGRLDAAKDLFEVAIAGLTQSRGSHHPYVGIVLSNYGNLLLEMGRAVDAQAAQQRALAIQQKTHGEVHQRVATVWNALGRSQLAQGLTQDAARSFAAGIAALPESSRYWRFPILKNLTRAEFTLGGCREALDHWRELVSEERDGRRAEALRWQAECLLKSGDQAAALESITAALAGFTLLPNAQLEHAEAERVLGEIWLRRASPDAAREAFARAAALLETLGPEASMAREKLARARSRTLTD